MPQIKIAENEQGDLILLVSEDHPFHTWPYSPFRAAAIKVVEALIDMVNAAPAELRDSPLARRELVNVIKELFDTMERHTNAETKDQRAN